MTIAFMLDFDIKVTRREGILTYVGFMLNSLLQYHEDVNVEVWLYSLNKENFKKEFADILNQYPERVTVYAEGKPCRSAWVICMSKIKYRSYPHISRFFYTIGSEKLGKFFYDRIDSHKELICEATPSFREEFLSKSKADCMFLPYPGLREALFLDKPIIMQIHDLFTFPLESLFVKETFPRADYKRNNRFLKRTLQRYAEKKTIFVSSSDYTKQTQILKYITNAVPEQCRVVPFPALYTRFDTKDIISEDEFRRKHDISKRYVAFPSQNRPNKNVILLLKALNILQEKGIELICVTTGKMSDCNSTALYLMNNPNLVQEIGTVSREELFCLYKYSEMVVCPNLIEGLGISGQCLEGISTGKAVVHVKSMGLMEALERVGLGNDLSILHCVEPNDEQALATEIEKVLHDRENVIMEQKKILEAFNSVTWKDVADSYYEIFNNCRQK